MNDQHAPMSEEMINHILSNLDGSKLSEWEIDFIRSIKTYWKKFHKLSEKQQKRLAEVWADQSNAKRVFRNAQERKNS